MSQDGHRIGRGLQRTDLCRPRSLAPDLCWSPEDVPGDWRTSTGVQRTCQEIGGRLLESRGRARRLENVSSSPEDVPGDWRTSPAVQRMCQEIGGRLQQSRGQVHGTKEQARRPEDEVEGQMASPGDQRTHPLEARGHIQRMSWHTCMMQSCKHDSSTYSSDILMGGHLCHLWPVKTNSLVALVSYWGKGERSLYKTASFTTSQFCLRGTHLNMPCMGTPCQWSQKIDYDHEIRDRELYQKWQWPSIGPFSSHD